MKPARKYAERALQLGAAGLSAAEGAILYNTSVAAVLGYVEQLCPLDATVAKLEQGAVERSLHAPHNAVPKGLLWFGGQFGMVASLRLLKGLVLRWPARLGSPARPGIPGRSNYARRGMRTAPW